MSYQAIESRYQAAVINGAARALRGDYESRSSWYMGAGFTEREYLDDVRDSNVFLVFCESGHEVVETDEECNVCGAVKPFYYAREMDDAQAG